MAMTENNAANNPIRLLVLDLIYPAVLGAMIVLLFTRIAPTAVAALQAPPTYFAFIIGAYYAAGFVNAKIDASYSSKLGALDFISSILIFVSFYLLGFAQEGQPTPVNYRLFYVVLVLQLLTPMFRRAAAGRRRPFRTGIGLLALIVTLVGIAAAYGIERLAWATPDVVAAALGVILLAYLVEMAISGAS
jgi:hypothetical protein